MSRFSTREAIGSAALVSAYAVESRLAKAGGSSIPPSSGPITTGAPSRVSGDGITGDTLTG